MQHNWPAHRDIFSPKIQNTFKYLIKNSSNGFQLIPMVNGRLSPIMVHFRPIMGIRSPVKNPPIMAPTGNKDAIQLPVSSPKSTGSVQF